MAATSLDSHTIVTPLNTSSGGGGMVDRAQTLTPEPGVEIKSEFYTREGLWRLLPECEYSRVNTASSNTIGVSLNGGQSAVGAFGAPSNNDPVRISFVSGSSLSNEKACDNCSKMSLAPVQTYIQANKQHFIKNLDDNSYICKYCNRTYSATTTSIAGNNNNIDTPAAIPMDFILFNYGRELWIYYFNGVKQPSEIKNLLDKKTYKTLSATCHDLNTEAYQQNANSLWVAIGFSKGEIHLFDAFKKDSSIFLNNTNKNVDKTKATCIKWVPKSNGHFLVSYTSGNMYLIDLNIQLAQNQSQQAQNTPQTSTQPTLNNSALNNTQTNGGAATTTTSPSSSSPAQQTLNQPQYEEIFKGFKYSIWRNSTPSQNPLYKWSINTKLPGINEFEFSPCGTYLAVACQDGFLRVFHYADKTLRALFKSYFGALLCVSWSHDGKYIATGGEDDLISVYSWHEQRLACRGRGHSSWVNCVRFDSFLIDSSINEQNDEDDCDSDFEGYHTKKDSKPNRVTKRMSSLSIDHETRRRTRVSSSCSAGVNAGVFYRLGSVAQDSQICLWDLTEDALREKSHPRSRVSTAHSANHNNNNNVNGNVNNNGNDTGANLVGSSNYLNLPKSPKIQELTKTKSNDEVVSSSGGSGGGFFKRKQRASSSSKGSNNTRGLLTSNTSSATLISVSSSTNSGSKKEKKDDKNGTAASSVNCDPVLDEKYEKMSLAQMCPKLDEVPLIEPLVCKRIANERLTDLVFLNECFLTACQDGTISTWARPGVKSLKAPNANSESLSDIHPASTCL